MRKALKTEQKALEINLDDSIYGSFAEIGAGQEVARYFFQVGAAAGTIAKTMSAYDKIYSDEIYGPEPTGRYVCEARVYKMLDHEYDLIDTRLKNERINTRFFVFADSVAAINYQRTIKGNGWLGIRFQTESGGAPNELVLHVRMLDNDNQLQQQAIGVLGVNLIYAVFRYQDDLETLVQSLVDNIQGRVAVDMIRLSGPDFDKVDNRYIQLLLVKHKLTDVAMFDPSGRPVHASEFMYKKFALVVRGSFRPLTLVNQDMIKKSLEQFRNEPDVDPRKAILLTEITMDNLTASGELDEQDFLDRADLLCAMGQTVIISDCEAHQKLIEYLSNYKIQKLGIVLGVRPLLDTINEKYYKNSDGRLLASFGELFTRNVKVYVYPSMQEGSEEMMTSQNLPVPDGIKFLFKHLIDSGQIADIENFDHSVLHIYSKDVLTMIQDNKPGWEDRVPAKVASLIKQKMLFNFPYQQMEFEY